MNHDACICAVGIDGRTVFDPDCEVHGWDVSPDEVDRRNFARKTRMRAEAFSRIDAPASAKVWKAK
jgi:hypothetical protein